MITPEVDELVALEVPPDFYAVGAHYARFNQLTDAEVKALLAGAQV
jgi:predicted phosphoribosyltransferase